jgi:glutamate/tyrosine decarboxylase-like PLP-dependent enzyme
MAAFAHQVLAWSAHDFAHRDRQRVGSSPPAAELAARLNEPAPEHGRPFEEVLTEFIDKIVPAVYRTDHPRFLGFVPSAPSFYAVLGDWLATTLNAFAGIWLEGAGAAQVEEVVLGWFKDLLGYPSSAAGSLTSGGSEANLTALVVARERLSFDDRSRAVLYVSGLRHRSVDRAAAVIGLRPEQVQVLPTDSRFRLPASTLAAAVRRDREEGRLPWCLVANAGATSTGSVDPLRDLAARCRAEGVWLHADAAYGWPAVLTPEGRELLDGLAEADSITLDPHKWLAQPYEAGCLLVREGHQLADAFRQRADYLSDLPDGDAVNFTDRGLALTRRFRALKVWVSVKCHGLGWFRELVVRNCLAAEYARRLLAATGLFQVVSPPQLSILCFRHVPPGRKAGVDELDRLNLRLAEELRATGEAFLSTTRLADRVALRLCFVNWRTTAADVERVVELLAELAGKAEPG